MYIFNVVLPSVSIQSSWLVTATEENQWNVRLGDVFQSRDETKTEIRTNTGRPLPFASLVNPHSDANEASFCRRQVISLRGVAASERRRVRLADLHFI